MSCNWQLKWFYFYYWNLFQYPSCDIRWLIFLGLFRATGWSDTRAHGMTPKRYSRYSLVKPWRLGQNHHHLPCQTISFEPRNDSVHHTALISICCRKNRYVVCMIVHHDSWEETMLTVVCFPWKSPCEAYELLCRMRPCLSHQGWLREWRWLGDIIGAMILWERDGKHRLVDEVL